MDRLPCGAGTNPEHPDELMNPRPLRFFFPALCALLLVACGPKVPTEGRGAGMPDATLTAHEQAQSYRAALTAAFDLGPGLSLLLDPTTLPRGFGEAPGGPVPDSVLRALRDLGAIQGTCKPATSNAKHAPICEAPIPGYVVRVSDVYAMRGDSLQLHVLVRRYDTPATAPHGRFDFEEAYQLARADGAWRVVRKGRIARVD